MSASPRVKRPTHNMLCWLTVGTILLHPTAGCARRRTPRSHISGECPRLPHVAHGLACCAALARVAPTLGAVRWQLVTVQLFVCLQRCKYLDLNDVVPTPRPACRSRDSGRDRAP